MINYLRKNSVFSFFIKFSAWLFIFLLILEVFIRVFVIKTPFQHFVPDLGYVPLDNSVSVWGVEGYGVTHYLSNGEISTPHQSETSVVVLGDSFTEALQVSNDQKFVSVAEDILHERGLKMDLHNLGASGRSIADYVYMAPFVRATYSPEIVVVQLSEADFTESFELSRQNFFARSGASIELIHNKDYYSIDQNLRNMISSTGLGSLAIYKLTPVVKEQRLRLAKAAGQDQFAAAQLTAADGLNSNEIKMQINLLKEAYPDSQVLFLVIPNIPTLQGVDLALKSESDALLVETMNEFSDPPLLYPRDEFAELYTAHKKFPRGFSNTLPNYGHLNSDGHFAVGAALADYLEGIAR
jgi:lysophospholipase L1-like esterase